MGVMVKIREWLGLPPKRPDYMRAMDRLRKRQEELVARNEQERTEQ